MSVSVYIRQHSQVCVVRALSLVIKFDGYYFLEQETLQITLLQSIYQSVKWEPGGSGKHTTQL